jgi:hypothetical protein
VGKWSPYVGMCFLHQRITILPQDGRVNGQCVSLSHTPRHGAGRRCHRPASNQMGISSCVGATFQMAKAGSIMTCSASRANARGGKAMLTQIDRRNCNRAECGTCQHHDNYNSRCGGALPSGLLLLLSLPLLLSVLSFLSVWLLSSPFILQILWTVLGVLRIRGKPSRSGCGVINGAAKSDKNLPRRSPWPGQS